MVSRMKWNKMQFLWLSSQTCFFYKMNVCYFTIVQWFLNWGTFAYLKDTINVGNWGESYVLILLISNNLYIYQWISRDGYTQKIFQGCNVDIALILFRLLSLQYNSCSQYTVTFLHHKRCVLRQQSQKCASLAIVARCITIIVTIDNMHIFKTV